MQKIRWFFLILAIALMLAAMLQNNGPTDITLLWVTRSVPLSVLLIATTIIGFLFGSLTTASMLRRHRKKKEAAAKESARQSEPKKPAESTLETATTE
jgi:uncharacterized integral membrane protein